MGHTVSVDTICNVKKDMERPSRRVPANRKMAKVKARQNATPTHIKTKVAAMISRFNQPPQRRMAAKLGVYASTICRIMRKVLNAKVKKKCKVYKISMAQVEKRRQRSRGLYRKLRNDQWKKRCDDCRSFIMAAVLTEDAFATSDNLI